MKKRMRAVVSGRRAGATGEGVVVPEGGWPLATPFRIGDLELPNRVVQAPLAGIGNRAFRVQAARHGAGLVVSEMVASMALHHGNARTREMIRLDADEETTAIQLFGSDPAVMAEAALMVQEAGADAVDINMGCPVPKICRTGAGAALLGDLDHAASVVRAMVDAVDIPVMVKMRRGITPRDARPLEAARAFEAAGAAALAVYPREADEEYSGTADHGITAAVAEAVDIPVIASGDITTPAEALEVMTTTGCDAVMIGRAALGDPWILSAMATGAPSGRPDIHGVVDEVVAFAEGIREVLGDERACHYMRKFYPWYLAGEDVSADRIHTLLVDPDLDSALAGLRAIADERSPRPVAR